MYDPYIIREALNNCIAHQDYLLSGRIQVVENEDGELIFSNSGIFLPETIENVVQSESPQLYYHNKFLVDIMVNLNMIDTIGSGIKRMFMLQKEKFFPLPSYNFSDNKVKVKIIGKVLDLNYARLLARKRDLSLKEIMLLDQVQKKNKISKESALLLKSKSLIEGRYPNIHVSKQVAERTGDKAQYIKNRAFNDEYYKDMIVNYLKEYNEASRKEIDDLIINKLPEVLLEQQKKNKIKNYLSALSKSDKIRNIGSDRFSKWIIVSSS